MKEGFKFYMACGVAVFEVILEREIEQVEMFKVI